MCGIGGLSGNLDTDPTDDVLRAMSRAMRHRGPDDEGATQYLANGRRIGLAATRLAIQDLSRRGRQPMASETRRCIAFNGEIYNVAELRRELEASGATLNGHSDTEVVLKAYDHWGPDCVERLRGMFAFALWDEPSHRLFLARDRLGIKPLYYYRGSDTMFVFASEIRALLASGLVPAELCPYGVSSYLATGAVVEPATIVAGVSALPPAHWAFVENGRLRMERYWSLRRAFEAAEAPPPREEAVVKVRSALEDAVRRHLVGDVPVGVFLSGGIDSTTIAALAAASGEPPQTVSVVFPQDGLSEERWSNLAAKKIGSRHTEVRLDERAFLAGLPTALEAMDQPTVDGINTFIVSGAARDAGLSVVLSGLGGDELFAGYPTFSRTRSLETIRSLTPGPLGRGLGMAASRLLARNDRNDKLVRWLGRRDAPESAYALQRELFSPSGRIRIFPSGQALNGSDDTSQASGDVTNRISELELEQYMKNQLLRDGDVMSMAHSLELRVPLLDQEVVETAAALPGRYKLRGRDPKPLLVEAVRDLLPPELATRPKMGFTLPFHAWLQRRAGADVECALRDPGFGGPAAPLLDPRALETVLTDFRSGATNWARPWALYVLKCWAERNLSCASAQSVSVQH